MEIVEDLSAGSNDLSLFIKGRRTKRRQRPLSPVSSCRAVTPAAVTSSSSSGGGGGGGGELDGEELGCFYPLIPSTTTSTSDISTTHHDQEQEVEEEDDDDQDIANCLILLAQGRSKQLRGIHHHHHQDVDRIKMEKLSSSRRLNEMAISTTGGKVGFFVYECKTCNRTFPSFQALGGHRASHKKPKVTIFTPPTNGHLLHHHQQEEEEAADYEQVKKEPAQEQELSSSTTSKLCLEKINSNKAAKNHECSICGAEFSSGQALGGHMRRHRNPPALPTTTTTAKVSMILDQEASPSSINDHEAEAEESHVVLKKRRNHMFQLDLNLPAPVEDDHHNLKFQPHHSLVFSAPALVGCHY